MISTVRILLVDAYAHVRSGLRALLESEADLAVVGEAGDVATAVSLTKTLQPHLIILDPHLTDFDSLEMIKVMRQQYPQIRILILSNDADMQHVSAALTAGVQGYWLKDNHSSQIIAALRQVMAGEWALHPFLAKLQRSCPLPASFDASQEQEI